MVYNTCFEDAGVSLWRRSRLMSTSASLSLRDGKHDKIDIVTCNRQTLHASPRYKAAITLFEH